MSVALFIVPERDVEGLDVFVDGKALAHCRPAGSRKPLGKQAERHLESLAREAGVRPLMDFFSQDPEEAMEFLEEAGVESPPGGVPPLEWYSASDGLVTVRGLLTYLASNPGAAAEVDMLIEDLRQFESVLARLETAGLKWHLAVDF